MLWIRVVKVKAIGPALQKKNESEGHSELLCYFLGLLSYIQDWGEHTTPL